MTEFGDDLVAKTKDAKIHACKARLETAIRAAGELETSVRWLVKERAWETLGYANFSEMWETHAGFKCPTHVHAICVDALRREGTRGKGNKSGGHNAGEIAEKVGLTVQQRGPYITSATVSAMGAQIDEGIPLDRIRKGHWKTRARGSNRRTGAGPNDLVLESVNVPREMADQMEEIARKARVPRAEIYRQAVAEYLQRHRESR